MVRTAARVVVVLSAAALAATGSGCATPTQVAPVAPGRELATPVGLAGGVLPTFTPTTGPSPTAVVIPTAVTPPPAPIALPPRFGIGIYAEGLVGVRMLAVASNGDVLATIPRDDRVVVLPDRNADGVADEQLSFASGPPLNLPSGIAVGPGVLFVASTDLLLRYPYSPGELVPAGPAAEVMTLPGGGRYPWPSVAVGLDGALYVGVGASCDACAEQDPRRAALLRLRPEAQRTDLLATGLRNPSGLAVDPVTGDVWVTDSGREDLGQSMPEDELNRVSPGADFGWPHCMGAGLAVPRAVGQAERCRSTAGPVVTFAAHSEPTGAEFYAGGAFPPEYDGGLFVALHGRVNDFLPTGHGIVFVPFADGYPTGQVDTFARGWLLPDTSRWGTPTDVAVAPDGSLLVSDEGFGRIYRVYYSGPRPTAPSR